ncbi:MAG: ATP-binding protein [Acidobacteriota bacterium]
MAIDLVSFQLAANRQELCRLGTIMKELGQKYALLPKDAFELRLVLDELITNIIDYGCADGTEHFIRVSLGFEPGFVSVSVEDDGCFFDPTCAPTPDTACSLEQRKIGGLGIHFMRNMVDEIRYERKGTINVLRMKKALAVPCTDKKEE